MPTATAKKPAAKKPKAPAATPPVSEADAALNETNGTEPTMDLRGLELTLPAALPASFALRVGKLQNAGDGDMAFTAMYELLRSLVGAAQLDRVMDHIDTLPDADIGDLLTELMTAVNGAYGLNAGK